MEIGLCFKLDKGQSHHSIRFDDFSHLGQLIGAVLHGLGIFRQSHIIGIWFPEFLLKVGDFIPLLSQCDIVILKVLDKILWGIANYIAM